MSGELTEFINYLRFQTLHTEKTLDHLYPIELSVMLEMFSPLSDMVTTSYMWLPITWNMASETEEFKILFDVNYLKFKFK